MFEKCNKLSLENFDISNLSGERLNEYYIFYTKTIKDYKKRFREALENFSCLEIHSHKKMENSKVNIIYIVI